MPRRAMSIVEVLVVVAAIALLLGVLAPALVAVGADKRSIACRANLRQMVVAAHNYAAIYDWFPPAIRYEMRSGVFHNVAWDWVTTFSNQVVSPGALWMFCTNPDAVQQCPEYLGTGTFGEPYTGYNYNTTYIGGEAPFPTLGWSQFRRGLGPHACARGSACAMFGDGGRSGGANKFMRAPLNSESVPLSALYNGAQAFRHAGGTNIGFIDGHVGGASQPRQGKFASPALLVQMGFPTNGFLSDNDGGYDPR